MKFWPLPDKKVYQGEDTAPPGTLARDGEPTAKKGDGKFRRGEGGVHLTTEGQLSWADQMAALYRRGG